MDGFKAMIKMKTGGSVSKAVEEKMCSGGMSKGGKYKEGGKVHDDAAQDKVLIKKELGKFAKKEDKEEKTELKLKSGGRAKKATGTVSKYKAGGVAKAPSEATKRPNLKGSDVEKEKGKPAGEKDFIKKVKPTGDKKADAPNKAAVKSKDVKKFATGGTTGAGGIGSQSPIPPSIAAQLMMAARGAQLQGANPPVMGTNPLPVDNPVVGGGMQGAPVVGGQMDSLRGQGSVSDYDRMSAQPGGGQGFNAYQNFKQQNPNAKPGMSPQDIQKLMQSRQFQNSNRNFTDR